MSFFLCLFLSFFPLQAANLTLSISPAVWIGDGSGYSALDAQRYEQLIQGFVHFDPCDEGDYFITFSRGSNIHRGYRRKLSGPSANHLTYKLSRDTGCSRTLKAIPRARDHNVIKGKITEDDVSPQPFEFYWTVYPGQNRAPGNYYDTVELNIYEGELDEFTHRAGPYFLDLSLLLKEHLFLSVVPEGDSFDSTVTEQSLAFGSFSEGDVRFADIYVVSNTGYDLFMESLNASRLSHSEKPSYIPYEVLINGFEKDLSSGSAVRVASRNSKTSAAGQAYRASFVLGSPSQAQAGSYSDSISIWIAAH